MNVCDIKDIQSESGVIASIALKPELSFYSEQLKPNHFSDNDNGYLYYAICELAKKGIEKVDAYNIINILNMRAATAHKTENLTVEMINDFLNNAKFIARDTPEEYKFLVDNVLNAAFRRDTCDKLDECKQLCFTSNERNIEEQIYQTLDGVMMEFSTTKEVPQYKDVVDELWSEIESRQDGAYAGIPFKFPALNDYATIERGELFIFAAEAKAGKSMMLLNCAVDLLRQGYSVLYIDSELSSRMFTARLISHITGIEFHDLKAGRYDDEGRKKIEEAKSFLKSTKFTHIYMPLFDTQSIYTTVKKVKHTQGIDVLIIDYFKGNGSTDAFETYAELGKCVNHIGAR